jgi:ATP-dependent Lon protease
MPAKKAKTKSVKKSGKKPAKKAVRKPAKKAVPKPAKKSAKKPASHPAELVEADLRWSCDPATFSFKTTKEVDPVPGTVGQPRALRALELGLKLNAPGYNVFVAGLTGTGKTTAVKNILEELRPTKPLPLDKAYVNNFTDPSKPRLLTFPRGQVVRFKVDMAEFVDHITRNIPLIFENKGFKMKREKIMKKYGEQEQSLLSTFGEKLKQEKFTLAQVQVGPFSRPEIFPVFDGKAYPMEKLPEVAKEKELGEEQVKDLQTKYTDYRNELETILEKTRSLAKGMVKEIEELARRMGEMVIDGHLRDLKVRYNNPRVHGYFDEVRESVLENLEVFATSEEEGKEKKPHRITLKKSEPFKEYTVNIVLDNTGQESAPVVIETAPTFVNLFGTVERSVDKAGRWITDFTMIKPGSIVAADGGYLVVNAIDLFTEPGVWKVLKRTLKNGKLQIQPIEVALLFGSSTLKPDPVELNVKVILIGDWRLYQMLYAYEPDFKKIFKIIADFDSVMDRSEGNVEFYASFVSRLSEQEDLLPFGPEGVAALVEYGVWRAGRQSKLSARFSDIADIVREAHYWAGEAGAEIVGAAHVEHHNLPEATVPVLIEDGTLRIDVKGEKVGQVTGLAVYGLGNYSFGRPNRITASVSAGRAGVINIEREAKMSGRTHDKGVLILSGFIRSRFGRRKPLTLSVSICFEQSYGGVDGDSASSTELYAILSAISGVPLRQDLAVTGSVDQFGNIQPIGGVNLPSITWTRVSPCLRAEAQAWSARTEPTRRGR